MLLDTNFSGRFIQVVEALSVGDAVSNQIIALDKIFKNLGLNSSIQTKWHDEPVVDFREALDLSNVTESDVVVHHYCGYSEYSVNEVLNCYATKIICYHNITPAELFSPDSSTFKFCLKGRQQLPKILSSFHYFWGDSLYNISELITLGAPPSLCSVVPIVIAPPQDVVAGLGNEVGMWLFVGRIAPNKCQIELVELFSSIRLSKPEIAKQLYIVGGYQEGEPYFQQLLKRIKELALTNCVFVVGKVSDDEREIFYRRATIFISASVHEGFGVPLVEAPLRGVPVVALNNTAIGETLGNGNGLASSISSLKILIEKTLSDSIFRQHLITDQLHNAKRFAPNVVQASVREALALVLPKRRHFRTVTVVICTYNRRTYLERVLDYLGYQTNPYFEVVVVDGPSDDGTKDLLLQYDGIIKIEHNPERNLSKSRNIGIELSTGDIIAFIDDDAIPFDDWINTILVEYNKRPLTLMGLGGPVYYAGTLKYQCCDIGFNKFADALVNINSSNIGKNGWARSLIGTNSTFTRDSLMKIGGFDEQYDYFLDESDLCWRMQINNGLLGYTDNLNLRHEFAESANRKGKLNFNWKVICKNTAYFIAAYSGLEGAILLDYLRERFIRERIRPLEAAVNAGDMSGEEYDMHVIGIWSGMDQGLADSHHFPRTRTLKPTLSAFLPFIATKSRLRVEHEIKRLHVCIVSKEFPVFAGRGGVGTLYYHLASELLLMGHEVTVVIPHGTYDSFVQGRFRVISAPYQELQLKGVDSNFANNINWSVNALAAVSELNSQHQIDVIDSALWDTEALAIALLPSSRRPPLLLRLVSPFPIVARINGWQVPPEVAPFFLGAERTLIEHADAVVPISESIAQTIEVEYNLLTDDRWRKMPCGVAYWPFFDVQHGYSTLQELENIPAKNIESAKLIVFVGRLEYRKGIDLVLMAANRILAADVDAQLVIAGRDTENWVSRAESHVDIAFRCRVHFLGEIADSTRDKLLARAYCLLFPSRYESFGLVPLEAFVHGVPVIGSRSGAIPEVVIDDVCGLLFESDNSESLARAVIDLCKEPSTRLRLSVGAKHRVRELSSRNMAMRTIQLYADLIRERASLH